MSRPNLLFIHTDQHRIDAMGAYGNRRLRTPNMDSIAAGGVRFTISYCTSPLCSPARSSFPTGRMPHVTGVTTNHLRIDPSLPNLASFLRAGGYDTAWCGKWHVPEEYPLGREAIPGFDNLPYEGRSEENHGYPVKVAGKGGGWKHNLGDYCDAPVAETAAKYIRAAHDKPFLLVVSLMNPHDICFWFGPDPGVSRPPVSKDLPPLPPNFAPASDEPDFVRIKREEYGLEGWNETQWRIALDAYYRYTEHVDAEIGKVLAALRDSGRELDTVVIYSSDHGTGVPAHRWYEKLMLYEEACAVPFIVSWKGRPPAGTVDSTHPVSGADVLPTCLGYAGVPPPPDLEGMDLRPLIEKPSLPGREYVVCALHDVYADKKGDRDEGRMVRTPRHKYACFEWGEHREMLFDMAEDPGETRNRARDPGMKQVLERHREMLRDWIVRTKDPFRGLAD